MPVRIARKKFDFLAKDYKTNDWSTDILPVGSDLSTQTAEPKNESNFIQRWYLSLQGEGNPVLSPATALPVSEPAQRVYRYDWAFGITLIEGFWWDWQKELREEGAVVIHLLIDEPEDAAALIPVGGTLSALRPSRNTRSAWETALPQIPRLAGDVAKLGKVALPQLEYASAGLSFAANVLESDTANKKNWFLYQFFEEKLQCPTVEWRINKRVLIEYGPLLRGTLYAVFYGEAAHSGTIRMHLNPGIGYFKKDDLVFIRPLSASGKPNAIYVDVKPRGVPRRRLPH